MYVCTRKGRYVRTNMKFWLSKWAKLHMCRGQQECTPAPQLTGTIAVHHCGGGRIRSGKRIRCLLVERRLGLWWCDRVRPSSDMARSCKQHRDTIKTIPVCVHTYVCTHSCLSQPVHVCTSRPILKNIPPTMNETRRYSIEQLNRTCS